MQNAESLQSRNVYCCRTSTGTLGHPDLDLSCSSYFDYFSEFSDQVQGSNGGNGP